MKSMLAELNCLVFEPLNTKKLFSGLKSLVVEPDKAPTSVMCMLRTVEMERPFMDLRPHSP